MNAAGWNSLQEQNLPGFPAGNGSGNGWEQFGGSNSAVIGESFLTGDSHVANATSVGLGDTPSIPAAHHDLEFLYGVIPAAPPVTGDYNNNGVVDAADYVLWRTKADCCRTMKHLVQPRQTTTTYGEPTSAWVVDLTEKARL